MPTRPPDFKSSGIRTERIIASGNLSNPRLLIIGSGSTNSDGVNVNTDTIKLSGTGSDTWLFISGSKGGTDRVTFGGDLYLSGTVYSSPYRFGSGLPVNSDTNFFVTGAAGSKDTTDEGTAVFAGDIVISGNIYNGAGVIYTPGSSTPGGVPGSVQYNDGMGGFDGNSIFWYDSSNVTLNVPTLIATALSGSLTTLDDGSSYLIEGSNITILSNSNGSVTISSVGGWNELSPSPRLNTTASVAIAGGLGPSYAAEGEGDDVFFFVSGTRNITGASARKSVFQGDTRVSGTLALGSGGTSSSLIFDSTYLFIKGIDTVSSTPQLLVSPDDDTYSLEVSGGLLVNSVRSLGETEFLGSGTVSLLRLQPSDNRVFISGSQVTVNRQTVHGGSDVNFFVSGIRGSVGSSVRGTSVFDGDVVTSGSVISQFGLSGSLTKLADGTSYLVAGTNISIASASNGAVTISSTGGGTSNWNELSPSPRLNTTASVSFAGGLGSSYAAESAGNDVFLFVSGTRGGLPALSKKSVFGGDLVVSGTAFFGESPSDRLAIRSLLSSDIIPDGDRTRNLGSASNRFANVYTGDLHLRNDRGDWTVIEESDFLTITNNRTGKRFKILMEPLD